jgi:hypothetical protein
LIAIEEVKRFLSHYGVKGMRWGVTKNSPSAVSVSATPGRKVKTAGGTGQQASSDAVNAAVSRQKAKKSTTDALSNKELQDLVNRMNLEQQYDRLRKKSVGEQALKFISSTLLGIGKDQASKYARDQVAEALRKA